MKTRSNQAKKSRNSENSKQPTYRHRAQSLPPSPTQLQPEKEQKVTKGTQSNSQQPTLNYKDMYSLSSAHLHDSSSSIASGRRMSHHFECPVEVQTQHRRSMNEKNILLKDMETEFLNARKVIISGLPPESNEENLGVFFKELSCIPVTLIKDGSVRVVFSSHQAASKALVILNSTILNCYQLSAGYGHPDSLLFVGNLPFTYSRDNLIELFALFGEVLRCLIVYSPETGLTKGYGFIEYHTRDEAMLAKQQMANKVVGLRSLRVDFADNGMQKCKDLQSETLFVDRLPKIFHEEEKLKEKFSNYGTVNFCQVATTPATGAPRGFAFIDMSSPQEAEHAQLACNGTMFAGQEIRVSFGMPCRHGACILHHKPNPPPHTALARQPMHMAIPAPLNLCRTTLLKETPHQLHWGHKVMLQGRRSSEGSILGQLTKPRPLMDTTNTQFDVHLLGRRGSFPHNCLECTHLLHHCCIGHSLSTPSLCTFSTQPQPPQPDTENIMEEDDHTHSHAQASATAKQYQFLAALTPPPQPRFGSTAPLSPPYTAPPSPPLPHPHYSATAPPSPHPHFGSTAPPSPQLPHPYFSSTAPPSPPQPHPHFGYSTAPPSPPQPHPHFGSTASSSPQLLQVDTGVEWEADSEEGSMLQAMSPQSLPASPTFSLIMADLKAVESSLLGKRLIDDRPQEVWGGYPTSVWGDDQGMHDQPYVGQHQQGIPFTHPLKRIRMEQY